VRKIVRIVALLLLVNPVFIKAEEDNYYIVNFKKDDSCLLNTDYHSVANNVDGQINGCYVADAAYLKEDKTYVYYKIGGDVVYSDKDDVEVLNVNNYLDKLSIYETRDNKLYHNIKNILDSDYYAYSIDLGRMPNELENNHKYYSYDGNYFYDDYKLMINDYLNNKYDNATNKTKYENYYQYLDIHSYTNYTVDDLNYYINNILGINGLLNSYHDNDNDHANDTINKSQLFGNMGAFKKSEHDDDVNALILLSMSIHESNYGKTQFSFERNDLFSKASFITQNEKKDSRYEKIQDSVLNFSKCYLSDKYLNPVSKKYFGSILGNKNQGINVLYSNDPYYGEKVASIYSQIDNALGNKDSISLLKESNYLEETKAEIIANKIELKGNLKDSLKLNECIDLSEAYLIINNNSFEKVYLTSEMINFIDTSFVGEKTLIISYGGQSIEKKINVFDDTIDKEELLERISNVVYCFNKNKPYKEDDLKYISENIDKYNLKLSFEEIRILDLIYRDNNFLLSYLIDENDKDIKISGLGLSLNINKSKFYYQMFDNTYYVDIDDVSSTSKSRINNFVSNYGFEVVDYLNIDYRYNLKNVSLSEPVIIELKLNKEENKAYVVYHLDENGNYTKCETIYTNNYLKFLSKDSGDFVILKKDSFNNVIAQDERENLGYSNLNRDTFKIMLEIGIYTIVILYDLIQIAIYYRIKNNMEKRRVEARKYLFKNK